MHTTELYFEAHITIEPVFGIYLTEIKEISSKFHFRVADLLMKKRPEDTETRSKHDTFMTTRHVDWGTIKTRTEKCVIALREKGFVVWRYKIENTLLDSKFKDELGLLPGLLIDVE